MKVAVSATDSTAGDVCVTNYGAMVSVISPSNTVLTTISVGRAPQGVVVA